MEIGGYISAPFAASMMAALGADVVKVERPVTGEDFRRGLNHEEFFFRQYNAGKRSLAVDLKRPEGVELVRSLVPRFDVVLENMRPGKCEALGLGYAACQALREDLVYASISGYGPDGPLAQRPAYDTMGQAFGGLYSVLSPRGDAQLSGTCMADLITGLTTVAGIFAALVGRGTSGQSTRVETSLMEAVSTLTIDAMTQFYDDGRVDPDLNSRRPQAQNFVLRTASGDSIAIHLSSSQKFWHSFARVIDRPELAEDSRFTTYPLRTANYFDLVPIVEQAFALRTTAEWEKLLDEYDIPFAPVLTMGGYLHHPQVEWLKMAEPEQDGLALIRPPWRFDGERPHRSAETPKVGQHTREVAGEVIEADGIDALVASGVLFAS